jgi:hypothetical protein
VAAAVQSQGVGQSEKAGAEQVGDGYRLLHPENLALDPVALKSYGSDHSYFVGRAPD